MTESLKRKAFKGVSWSMIERFSVQGINFLLQILLARLLLPSDFGTIAILMVFVHFSQVLIDSGFSSALIQKQDCNNEDYSTVFYCNLILSVLIYLILFVIAPYIAIFYKIPTLTLLLRVISISLLFNAMTIVQRVLVVKKIEFKLISLISIVSASLSGGVGFAMAIAGLGIWSLVVQIMMNSVCLFCLFSYYSTWHPTLLFSKKSFRDLFSFGSKLLLSSMINSLYHNIYSIIIGKRFNVATLGYFNRADQFAMFPSNNLALVIIKVTYPILSKLQDNEVALRDTYRKIIKYSSFIIFPLMIGLLVLAEPLISVVLSDKWSPAVPFLQILCLDWMLDHISGINLNLLYVKKRSDLALRLEILKKSIAVLILFLTLPFGLVIMCWGRVVYSVIATYINTIYTKNLICLPLYKQLMDLFPFFLSSVLMGAIVYATSLFSSTPLFKLLIGSFSGFVVYTIIALLFFNPILKDIKNSISF